MLIYVTQYNLMISYGSIKFYVRWSRLTLSKLEWQIDIICLKLSALYTHSRPPGGDVQQQQMFEQNIVNKIS